MWRNILLSKNNIKQLQTIKKTEVLLNISLKNAEISSKRLLNCYTLKCLNLPSTNTNLTQFSRTLVSNTENLTQKSLKEPLHSNEPKQKPKYDFEQLKKLFAVFLSGCAAYFAISYVLDSKADSKKINQTTNEDIINYESKNLPGKVKISKSVINEPLIAFKVFMLKFALFYKDKT